MRLEAETSIPVNSRQDPALALWVTVYFLFLKIVNNRRTSNHNGKLEDNLKAKKYLSGVHRL
jgi:hypothetical protein